MGAKRLNDSKVEQIVAMACEQIERTGSFDPARIGASVGFAANTVGEVVRGADYTGRLPPRTCQHKLAVNDKRCGKELPIELRGRYQATSCLEHSTVKLVASLAAPPVRMLAEAGIERQVIEAPVAEVEAPTVELATITMPSGGALEGLELEGRDWVTLRTLFAPFGKDVDKQMARLRSWVPEEDLRKERVPSTGGPFGRGGGPQETWLIAAEHAPLAIAELDTQGMGEEVRKRFVAYKREAAPALHAYFTKGLAVNPRLAASPSADMALAIQSIGALIKQGNDSTAVLLERQSQIIEALPGRITKAIGELIMPILGSNLTRQSFETRDATSVPKAADGECSMSRLNVDACFPEGNRTLSKACEATKIKGTQSAVVAGWGRYEATANAFGANGNQWIYSAKARALLRIPGRKAADVFHAERHAGRTVDQANKAALDVAVVEIRVALSLKSVE